MGRKYTKNTVRKFISINLGVDWANLLIDFETSDYKFAEEKDFDKKINILRTRNKKTREVCDLKFSITDYEFLCEDKSGNVIDLSEKWREFLNQKEEEREILDG